VEGDSDEDSDDENFSPDGVSPLNDLSGAEPRNREAPR
jgi:hypothetical protein